MRPPLPDRCLVMGIVNRTPDSFYDGGRMTVRDSVDHALRLVDEGADIIDLGGVKAGPGAPVSGQEELARLLPLVETLASRVTVPLSVETASPLLARRLVAAGASLVNDVSGLASPELADVCAASGAMIVLMHHVGQIRGRPRHPRYVDVVEEIARTWSALAEQAIARGIAREQIIVDPGLDFGKTTWHSLELMRRLDELVGHGWPVLVAPSNKDVVGETLGVPLDERLEGTLALVALSVLKGAAIVRVHEVGAAVRTVAMVEAVSGRRAPTAPIRGLWE